MSETTTYAKDREDLWIIDQFPDGYSGYAVELGACDGTFISCTKLLEEMGWNVLCIEPNPVHQDALRGCRKNVLTCACDNAPRVAADLFHNPLVQGLTQTSLDEGHGYWTKFSVTVLTLDQCLMVANFPRLDALVLDVDGYEERILDGFSIDKWMPKVAIIEDASGGQGESKRLSFFTSRGYRLIDTRADGNKLLVREDL